MAVFDAKNRACIVGVGTSQKFGFVLNKSAIVLSVEALKMALDDAGLKRDDIDGYSTAHGSPGGVDYEEMGVQAGCNFRWVTQFVNHGRWTATSISTAAMAVCAGYANYVAVLNTNTNARGYGRHFPRERGFSEGMRDIGSGHGLVAHYGLDTPGAATSMVARKYMTKYGATSEELAATAIAFRKHANLNPMAIMHDRTMTQEDYMNSRMVSPPYRLFDYCLVNEGSTCLIITTAERARNLKKKPVYITGYQGDRTGRNNYTMFGRPGLGLTFEEEFEFKNPETEVYQMAGVTPKDIDVLYMYDSFSTNLWMVLERFGFCKEGEGHAFCQNGRIELGGELPVNTNGGLMSEGHYSGYNQNIEMVRQLRGECGPRQVENAEVGQWSTPWGASLILTKG